MKHIEGRGAELVFLIPVLASILTVAAIYIFLFVNGVPTIGKIGIFKFPVGETWKPGNNVYGILSMILGSIYVTVGAVLVSVPIGILTTVFMAKFRSKRLYKVMKPAIDLLAGIPSVVYGFFGLVVIVPVMNDLFDGSGKSIATTSVLLGIMILPTIIGVSELVINAVPDSYHEGALALGASHEKSAFFATLPVTKPGILADVILGARRTTGKTVTVTMVAGNRSRVPKGIFQGVRILTANIVMEMGYAVDSHREALIAIAVMLFVFTLLINLSFSALNRGAEQWVR